MSKLQKNLTLWAAFLGLVFALSVRPALAQTTSPSPQASPNPSDAEKKKSKKNKKEKSTDSQTGQSSTGAQATDSGTSTKSKKEKTSEASPEATKPSAATKTETSSSDTGTTKKSKKSTKSEETTSAGAPSTPSKTAETSKPVESKPLPQTDKPAGGSKTESGGASAGEIASAQASGKVWVNLDSGIYHKSGQYYGHTKNGKFMTEAEAQKAGYREAKK
jgi:hypothetical protein